MSIIPNTNPKLFSLSAVAVGYLLIDDLTANEQNALGNWLMLVGQLVSTNAYYAAVVAERKNNNQKRNDMSNEDTLKMLEKMLRALENEVNELKKDLK